MYWLALCSAAPIIATAAVVPVALAVLALSNAPPGAVAIVGFDAYGVMLVFLAFATSAWKLTCLSYAAITWNHHRTATLAFWVIWFFALMGASAVVHICGVKIFNDGAYAAIVRLCGWLIFDIVASLIPHTLLRPTAWKMADPDATGPEQARPPEGGSAADPLEKVPAKRPRPSAPRDVKRALLDHLMQLQALSPNESVAHGLVKHRDGSFTTSQRTLAAQLEVSTATVNRYLRTLSSDGIIVLDTSERDTRITLVSPQSVSANDTEHALKHPDDAEEKRWRTKS